MNERSVEPVLTWMKGTDLVEVHYTQDGASFTLTLRDAYGPVDVPAPVVLPVSSPAVGVFRRAAPGRAAAAEKGSSVKKGQALGLVESGKSKTQVEAPAEGRIVRLLADDGQGVEFGQALFLIEPN